MRSAAARGTMKTLRWLLRNIGRRFVRLLLRVGLLPANTRAETDTMGEWKRLMEQKDDPRPGLVLPDPNAPHAALIRRVRLYAQNGAKALAPLLDQPLPDSDGKDEAGNSTYADEWANRIRETLNACEHDGEARAIIRSEELGDEQAWNRDALAALHAAYNSPWTVVDGEVYEYESDRKRRVVQ